MERKIYSINPKAKGRKPLEFVINPEKAIVYKENTDLSLMLNASAFRIRNSFYWNELETLRALEYLIDDERDFEYKMALAMFLSDSLGIRLAPVIILTREAMKAKELGYDRDLIRQATLKVMDRPDKIANACAYGLIYLPTFKALPPFYKKVLKHAFERFDAYTLRKFRLKRRVVKTADIIKVLHPRPRNAEMSSLYKAIIENSPEASIKEDTVITEVLSSTEKTKKEKRTWVSENISNLPLNALIRNLENVPVSDENLRSLRTKLHNALRVEHGLPQVKVANPFDMLIAGLNTKAVQFINLIDGELGEYVNGVELGLAGKRVSILVDVSGSMGAMFSYSRRPYLEQGIGITNMYLAMLLPMLQNTKELTMYSFNTGLHNKSKNLPVLMANSGSPITIFSLLKGIFKPQGGTALADSVKKVVRKENPDLLLVFSDEVSWADHYSTTVFEVGANVIAVNPFPQGIGTVFNPDKPIVKLSALDAKIFYYIPMLTDFGRFKKWLKDEYIRG